MTVTVDQQKLVLNAFAATFQNNLTAAEAVTWRQYDSELNDRNALSVSEQVGPRYAVTQTVAGVQDLTSGVQDSVFGSEQFKVDRIFGSSMGWADFVKIRDVGAARESEALKNAAMQLAEVIDAYILNRAVLASNNWIGTPGNGVATWGDIQAGYTRLKEEGVDDADLRCMLTYADKQNLGSNIISLASQTQQATGVYRKGFEGEVGGIPTMFTQQLPVLTTGSRAATGDVTVTGANQNVNYKNVAVSGAPGQYMTQTINLAGTVGHTIQDGEVFTIAGVYAYDNRAQKTLDHLQQFRVVGSVTLAAGANSVRIFPAIIVPGSGTGGDINVNTAHATVNVAPIDTAAVTFIGTASTAYTPRVILQKEAIVVNTAPLIMPATGRGMSKGLTKVPVTVRMWQHSDFNTGQHFVRFDCALNANVRDRRRIVRINGA